MATTLAQAETGLSADIDAVRALLTTL